MWPILFGVISFIYGGTTSPSPSFVEPALLMKTLALSIRAFLLQRRQFNELLKTNNTSLNISRYFRLMMLASTEMLFSLPFSLYLLSANIQSGLHPWISWEDTHAYFNRSEYLPASIFKLYPRSLLVLNITRYSLPASGFIFFLYFGLAGESGVFYKRLFWTALRPFGIYPNVTGTHISRSVNS